MRALAAADAFGTIAAMRIAIVVAPLTLLCAVSISAATPLDTGMRMPAITLTDQHDAQGSVTPDTRCVVFNRDMSGAKVIEEGLATDSAGLLEAAGAVIVSDISGMPRLISKLFALPALRKRPYSMLLDREGKVTADFPFAKGKVTVLHLHALTIERVEYVESAEALRATLRQAAQPPAGEGQR
jgi:hypothetical protein